MCIGCEALRLGQLRDAAISLPEPRNAELRAAWRALPEKLRLQRQFRYRVPLYSSIAREPIIAVIARFTGEPSGALKRRDHRIASHCAVVARPQMRVHAPG